MIASTVGMTIEWYEAAAVLDRNHPPGMLRAGMNQPARPKNPESSTGIGQMQESLNIKAVWISTPPRKLECMTLFSEPGEIIVRSGLSLNRIGVVTSAPSALQ
jgi:hypothetical protein